MQRSAGSSCAMRETVIRDRFIPKTFDLLFPQVGVPLLRHNGPDERRASPGRQDCVEFA
jgi:hypothetical protein